MDGWLIDPRACACSSLNLVSAHHYAMLIDDQ
jgi:hypothetical protein